MRSITFIVPFYNSTGDAQKRMVLSFLPVIKKNLFFQTIFVDDATTDGTSDWLANFSSDRVQIIFNKFNLGYAKSINLGASQASGDILILLNNDLEFNSPWLEPMLSILESSALNAGIVGNIQRRISDGSIDHVGFELTPQGKFVHDRQLPEPSIGYSKVSAVTGACLAIRRADFEAVGGFDEGFLNGGEDVDLCFKIAVLGKSIYVSHESQIKHHVALSRDLKSPQNEKNSQLLFQKWRPQIKNLLSRVWQPLLSSDITYSHNLDGNLSSEFLTSSRTAARVISEIVLAREEHRWARELYEVDLNADINTRITVLGARYSNVLLGYLVNDEIQIILKNTTSIQNFYVCGRKLNEASADRLDITITVNDIQRKIFTLGADRHINVGIINPILLGGMDNVITVSIQSKFENGVMAEDGKAILITHFVIDEKTVNQF